MRREISTDSNVFNLIAIALCVVAIVLIMSLDIGGTDVSWTHPNDGSYDLTIEPQGDVMLTIPAWLFMHTNRDGNLVYILDDIQPVTITTGDTTITITVVSTE